MKEKGTNNNNTDLRPLIEVLQAGKYDFQIIYSNYQTELVSPIWNIKLMSEERGHAFFNARNKIINDLETKTEIIQQIENFEGKNNFYEIFNLKELKNRQVFAFDLSGAYCYALVNSGLINPTTFGYLMKLNKSDRLPAIGSIASKKNVLHFVQGEPSDVEIIEGKFRKVFFYLVEKTFNAMNFISEWARQYFGAKNLFSWVDCLYIDVTNLNENDREIISHNVLNEFENLGFRGRCDLLTEFTCIEKQKHYICNYKKPGKESLTIHTVPKIQISNMREFHRLYFGN